MSSSTIEVRIDTTTMTPAEAADKVIEEMVKRGILGTPAQELALR